MDHVELLAALVAIDSVNPGLVPGAAGEETIAAYVAQWLREAGAEVRIEHAAPGRPNVVAVIRGTGSGRSLLLNAHTDTVGAGGMEHPFQPRIENGRLYGRGAYDMKGSLAAAMIVMARLAAQPAAGDVILTAVCDEEYTSIGTAAAAKTWRADAAIVTEPTALDICVAHKGFVWFEIESRGRAAHGSRPDLGIDAIAGMGRILTGLATLDADLRRESAHPLLDSGSVHASLIGGGRELSTYPDLCRLSAERRTVPGESRELVEAEIERLIAEANAGGVQLRGTVTLVREPFEVNPEEPVVRVLREEIARHTGRVPRLYGETPWFDSAILSAAGIPAVIFGPGGAGAHADVEWSDLEQVHQCADILESVARSFCSSASASSR